MMALDTGICAPETPETLLLQQNQLIRRKRPSQMFPRGTSELPLPLGFARYENVRGIYHFGGIEVETIMDLSGRGRENEILLLGPFSKYDVALRLRDGEKVTYITEYIGSTELRCAIGSDGTIDRQFEYFEKTREPDGVIVVGECPIRVTKWLVANDLNDLMRRAVNHG
jgi:hypothetical protein